MASKNCPCTVLFFRNFICYLTAFMKGPKSWRVMNRVVLNAFFYQNPNSKIFFINILSKILWSFNTDKCTVFFLGVLYLLKSDFCKGSKLWGGTHFLYPPLNRFRRVSPHDKKTQIVYGQPQ